MKRILALVMMVAMVLPGYALPFGGFFGNPGHGGPGHGGHNPGHDNNSGNGGYNPGHGGSNPGNGGYNPGHGGSNPGNGGYNPGHGGSFPGNGGYNPGHGGSYPGNGGYNPGHGGHNPGPDMGNLMELRQSFRQILGFFRMAETLFSPRMDPRQTMAYAQNLEMLDRELRSAIRIAPQRLQLELSTIQRRVQDARFTLLTENHPRMAHNMVMRSYTEFELISNRIIGR